MIADIKLFNGLVEIIAPDYTPVQVDISQDAPTVIFGPATVSWGQVTHIEAHDENGLLYRQNVVGGPIHFGAGATKTLSIGSIQLEELI